MAILEPQQR